MTAVMRPVFAALARYIPTFFGFVALAGVALLGHWTEWKIPNIAKIWGNQKSTTSDDEGRTRVEVDPCLAAACGLGYVYARPADRLRVVFPTTEDVEKAGLKTVEASTRSVEQSLAAVGELDFDRTSYAVLAPRATGTVWHVYAHPGDGVKRGQLLALIEAADVGRAKSDFLNSLVQVERRAGIVRATEEVANLTSEPHLRETKASLREARIKLFNDHQTLLNLGFTVALEDMMNEMEGLKKEKDEMAGLQALFKKFSGLGVPPSLLRGMPEDGLIANLLPLTAPFDGVVVSMRKAKGEAVGPMEPQYVVADLGKLWLMLTVRPDEADKLTLGQAVFFRAPGMDREVQGQLTWISPEADEKTRVVMARAEIANVDGKLRPHTFGAGRIVTEKHPCALTVPDAAVQTDEGVSYVFVRLDETTFQVRRVEIGGRQNGFIEIVHGVNKGEFVVTTGSHVLKSELFKDRIGGED
jgi:membrane fusion protein, heavy metal efflux system